MNRTLYLKKKNSKGEEVLFPSSEQPAFITEYTYSAARMGGVPTITGTVKHPLCLDDLWTREEYVEFEGVKFYVTQVPTSSKSNDDIRYKHEITFRSERDLLDNIYFFDVVTPQTESQYADRFRSNATKFSFYGDIKEFVSRLNDSLVYSGIGDKFNIVIDEGIESDTKEISFSDKFFSEALQEIFNIYELPYYWVGNTCHVGECQVEKSFLEDEYLAYGQDNGLLSVSKTNGNYRLIDRVTGIGSSNNIPYYYPNSCSEGTAIFEVENMSLADVQKIDLGKVLSYNTNLYQGRFVLRYSPDWYQYAIQWGQNYDVIPVVKEVGQPNNDGFVTWEEGYILVGAYVYATSKSEISLTETSWEINKPSYIQLFERKTETVVVDMNVNGHFGFHEDNISVVPQMMQIIAEGWYFVGIRCTLRVDQYEEFDPEQNPLSYISIIPRGVVNIKHKGGDGYFFSYGDNKTVSVASSGIELTGVSTLPCEYSQFDLEETIDENGAGHYRIIETLDEDKSSTTPAAIRITGRKWITPQQNLMPPIYLESDGAERFYNAINNEYEHPDGGYYVFPNEYVEGKQREGIVSFDDIMPTIKGVVNANNVPFVEIADVAFDENDSDIQDDEGNYIHSYFYIRLNIFNGQFGFNLFAQALETGAATINMTSGNCAPCAFEIAVEKELVDGKYVFYNPVVTDGQGNLKKVSDVKSGASYMGDYIATMENRDNWTDEQQNTYLNSVWIAVKKETDTFGIVMPNSSNKHRPSKGDTFVITNILMPDVLIRAAENRLKEQLIEYLAKNNVERFDFSNKLSRVFIHSNPGIVSKINENSKINVVYNDKAYPLYVTNYTCRADGNILDEISVELATELSPSQNSIQKQISAIKGDIIKATSKTKPSSVDLASLDKRYLSKLNDDTAKGEITFEKGAKFGQNHSINEQGNATLNDVTANRYKGKNGVVNLDGDTEISGGMSVEGDTELDANLQVHGNTQHDKSVTYGNYSGAGFLDTGAAMLVDPNTKETTLIVDYARFRKKAEFTEITVAELKSVGGEIIISPAHMVIAKVEVLDTGDYKCYFQTSDGDRTIKNQFAVDDQARCQVFNLDSGSRYYWRLVTEVGTDYIVLSATDCNGTDIPQVGDNLCQLGNRTDTTRQSAIILSAYGADAPSRKSYQGINSYDLTNCLAYGESYNPITGRNKSEVYGDAYIGDKEKNEYIEYTQEDGLKVKGKVDVQMGANNLILNSSFEGDYSSETFSEETNLDEVSDVYSDRLTHWSYDNVEIVSESGSYCKSGNAAVLTNGWLEQQINNPPKSTAYVLSFSAKGEGDLIVLVNTPKDEYLRTISLNESWSKYSVDIKATSSEYIRVFFSASNAVICDIQLERGYNVTDWKPSEDDADDALHEMQTYAYLLDAIRNGNTSILGGLVMSKMLMLGNYKDGKLQRNTAGISGIYNNDDDVVLWGGGSYQDAIRIVAKFKNYVAYNPTEEEWQTLAKFAVTHGGDVFMRGYIHALGGYFRGMVDIADGKIRLNPDGSGHLADGNISWNADGDSEVKGTIKADNFYHKVQWVNYTPNNKEITNADIVIVGDGNWGSDGTTIAENTIHLPNPVEYEGKVITIYSLITSAKTIYIDSEYGSVNGISAGISIAEYSSLALIAESEIPNWRVLFATSKGTNGESGGSVVVPSEYTLPIASATTLGGVKVNSGTEDKTDLLMISNDGVLNVDTDKFVNAIDNILRGYGLIN